MRRRFHPRLRDRRGFTLTELLIASAVATVVIAAILSTYVNMRRRIVSQQILADMYQNVRFASTYLSRDLAMAGYGLTAIPFNQLNSWLTWVPGFTANPLIAQGASDSVILAAAYERSSRLGAAVGAGATSITVASGDGAKFSDASHRVIYIGRSELARVTGISGDTLSISTGVTTSKGLKHAHSNGVPVEMVCAYRYTVQPATGDHPAFLRRENLGMSGATIQQEMITEGIEDLQLQRVNDTVQVVLRGVATRPDETVSDEGDRLRRVTVTNAVSLRNL